MYPYPVLSAGEIETNTNTAKDHVEKGTSMLEQASRYGRGYTKALLCLLLVVLIIAGGLTAYFVITSRNHKKH